MNMSSNKSVKGYTLMELVFVVALVAIFATLGYPTFRSSYRHWVVRTTTDELVASMNAARLRSVTNNTVQSGVCGYEGQSQDSTECGTWFERGYLQYDAEEGTASKVTPRHLTIIPEAVKICANTWHRVYFDHKGKAWYTNTSNSGRTAGGNRAYQGHDFIVYPKDCDPTQKEARQVTVLPTGRVESIRYVMCPSDCYNVN